MLHAKSSKELHPPTVPSSLHIWSNTSSVVKYAQISHLHNFIAIFPKAAPQNSCLRDQALCR